MPNTAPPGSLQNRTGGTGTKTKDLQAPPEPTTPGSSPTAWNPSGYWPDPFESRFSESFRPHEYIGSLLNSPEGQAYGNTEGPAASIGVQGIREGQSAATDEAKQEAANQGLGRGYAQQQETNIRENANAAVADTLLGAHLEGVSRRYQQAAMLASSLIETNKARYNYFLQKKAQNAAEDASFLGFLGDILGGALGGVGSIIGGQRNNNQNQGGGGGGNAPYVPSSGSGGNSGVYIGGA